MLSTNRRSNGRLPTFHSLTAATKTSKTRVSPITPARLFSHHIIRFGSHNHHSAFMHNHHFSSSPASTLSLGHTPSTSFCNQHPHLVILNVHNHHSPSSLAVSPLATLHRHHFASNAQGSLTTPWPIFLNDVVVAVVLNDTVVVVGGAAVVVDVVVVVVVVTIDTVTGVPSKHENHPVSSHRYLRCTQS